MYEIVNGFKKYDTKAETTIAINNLNLIFDKTGLVILYGVSGCGKTTLLNCISGLDNLTSGEIKGFEKDDISFVFQDYALIDNMSIWDNLKIASDISGVNDDEINKALNSVNLNVSCHKKINELSGGQKQRVAIARSLVLNRKVILADEPTGNLDTTNSEIIAELLKEVSKDRLVIVVTHNRELFEKYADRFIELSDGQVKYDSNPYNNNYDLEKTNHYNKKLKFHSILSMFKSNNKHNYSKMIVSLLIIFLITCSLYLFFNIFTNNKSQLITNFMKDYNMTSMSFSTNDGIFGEEKDLILSRYKNSFLIKKNELEFIYNDKVISHSIAPNIYLSDENKYVIHGNNKLSNDEIIVSYEFALLMINDDYSIDTLSIDDINNVIGSKLECNGYEIKVVGIDNKIKRNDNFIKYDSELDYNTYVFMNYDTYDNICKNEVINYTFIDVGINDYYDTVRCDYDTILKTSDIVLSNRVAMVLFGSEYESYKNQVYEFNFNLDGRTLKKAFKIVDFSNETYISKDSFIEMFKYNNDYESIGLFIKDINESKINYFSKHGLNHSFYGSEDIKSTKMILNGMSNVLLIISLPMIIVLVLYLFIYSKQNIITKKHEIGILKSMSVSNKEISKIFLIDGFILCSISLILGILVSAFLIKIANKVFMSFNFTFNPLTNNPLLVIIIIVFIVIVFVVNILFNIIKLNKKSDADLIYER